MRYLLLILISCSCGKNDGRTERCRSAEEAQIKCQLDYVEKYELMIIPDWVKKQCVDFILSTDAITIQIKDITGRY